jgi:preprotein translocase subunit SecG
LVLNASQTFFGSRVAANGAMEEVTIGSATSFAAACILLVLLLVAAQLCLTINSVQVSDDGDRIEEVAPTPGE